MHSNYSDQELIQQLQQQINDMQQYIHKLNEYIHHLNVYEYYIQGLIVGKVSGTLQLGQLIQNDLKETDGIHRFYIGEIKIREIEGTGTVGLGVADKGETKQESSEENSQEHHEIYRKIKTLMDIDEVPAFFTSLDLQILKRLEEWMNKRWHLGHDFTLFYEKTLAILNERINPDIHIDSPTFEEDTYIELADQIELQAKTLLVISTLLEETLPGYLTKYKQKTLIQPKKMIAEQFEKTISIKQMLNHLKDTFILSNLPTIFYDEVDEHPDILRYFVYQVVQSLIKAGDIYLYLEDIQHLLIHETLDVSKYQFEIDIDMQGVLYQHLIEYLDRYVKYILIEYLLLQM